MKTPFLLGVGSPWLSIRFSFLLAASLYLLGTTLSYGGTFTYTGGLNNARSAHTATLLPNGKVLVAGGYNGSSSLATVELYDPTSGNWTTTGSLATARCFHTATLLSNGKVLVVGGDNGGALARGAL